MTVLYQMYLSSLNALVEDGVIKYNVMYTYIPIIDLSMVEGKVFHMPVVFVK